MYFDIFWPMYLFYLNSYIVRHLFYFWYIWTNEFVLFELPHGQTLFVSFKKISHVISLYIIASYQFLRCIVFEQLILYDNFIYFV